MGRPDAPGRVHATHRHESSPATLTMLAWWFARRWSLRQTILDAARCGLDVWPRQLLQSDWYWKRESIRMGEDTSLAEPGPVHRPYEPRFLRNDRQSQN